MARKGVRHVSPSLSTFLRLYQSDLQRGAATGGSADGLEAETRDLLAEGKNAAWYLASKRYEVLRPLGIGGNGAVFLVWSWKTETIYALKVIRGDLPQTHNSIERFRKEADLWTALGVHRNIVTAHFLDVEDDALYLTLEYVGSPQRVPTSLADWIASDTLTDHMVADWFVQIADGLEHAYANGIVAHRDIKPSNILVDVDGTAKVADFGLASGKPSWEAAL